MKIAVVILNWNGKKLLEQFLPSVIAHSGDAVVYLADNASTDNSVSFVKEAYPHIKIIQNTGNHGFAKGYNDALQYVDEDIYCLLNSDVEVTANWLVPILAAFGSKPGLAIAQPKILDHKNKAYFEYAGAAGGYIDKYGYPFCRGRIFDTLEKDEGQYNDDRPIFWASGACFFIRKTVFRELGGFDVDFFAHQEEIDLCWRSKNLGHETIYIGSSSVFHVGGATLKEGNPKKTYLNFRNSLFMLAKNLPNKNILFVLVIRMILDGIAAFRFLFQLRVLHFLAVIKAHIIFYLNLQKFLKKRGTQKKSRNYYLVKSIVSSYYVYKLKRFPLLVKK